jgi:DNA-binding IclR family transcriptional regulator
MDKAAKTHNVRAVERAMRILTCFDDGQHAELGVSDIARATRLHKATAHRIIMTLVSCGFLERTAHSAKFRLGLRVVELGLHAMHGLDFRRAALPYMEQLVERYEETCTLLIFDRGQVLFVEVVQSTRSLTVSAGVGRHLPAHCTAAGKALLAFLPTEVVDAVLSEPLEVYTDNTITSPDRFREELRLVRERGYSLADEEFEVGLSAVAAPIRDVDGNVVAAFSIPGPTNRLGRERTSEIAQALLEAAKAVSPHVQTRITR